MLCQICGKNPGTLHITEIQNGRMTELHLCESCAEEKGLKGSEKKQAFDIADLVAGMMSDMSRTEEERVGRVQCPSCGLLYTAFKETGRLGCAECYNAFQFQLRPLLRRLHGDTRHRGKVPARDGEGATRARQIRRLHEELQRAVDREEFERAAQLRDEIRQLEAEESAPGGERR